MKRVYVAGPYSHEDVAENVRNAYHAASRLADAGCAPFVPHHTHFWHLMFPRPYEEWLKLDLAFLACCDALLRLPGESAGADSEVEHARRFGIPVFVDLDRLLRELR
jgi:hypothetical protein